MFDNCLQVSVVRFRGPIARVIDPDSDGLKKFTKEENVEERIEYNKTRSKDAQRIPDRS